MVNANSLPVVAFHGTFSDIKKFEGDKAGAGILGLGFYFTGCPLDASSNYANAPKFARLTGIAMDRLDNSGVVMPCLLNINNPIIVGGKDTTRFSIADGSLKKFIGAFLRAHQTVPAVPASGVSYMANQRFPLEARDTKTKSLTMEEIVDLVRRQLGLNAGEDFMNGDTRSKMVLLQNAFLGLGYDGVVYNDVKKRFGAKMENITKATRHYVVFKAEQISPALGTEQYIQAMKEIAPQAAPDAEVDSDNAAHDRPRG